MMGLRVALVTSVITAALIGCASSHTKPKHEYAYPKHAYGGSHGHSYSHHYGHSEPYRHGYHHSEHRTYHRPAPVPGRTPDGRYVLPGGLESVCAGGTPPPCQ
jgi:hypothetical protein